jgi:polyprenyl P-hydroxybenzoate/phenylacrylic acid decarboxylase-like protein
LDGIRHQVESLVEAPTDIANLRIEKPITSSDFANLCTYVYDEKDLGANPASGTFLKKGMAIVPCSMKTLACVANGISDNLVTRSAEVCLKEKRKLVLVPRETPLSLVHLRNMVLAAEAGTIILPAMPGFYNRPKDLHDLVDHVVGKILDALGIKHELVRRWTGDSQRESDPIRNGNVTKGVTHGAVWIFSDARSCLSHSRISCKIVIFDLWWQNPLSQIIFHSYSFNFRNLGTFEFGFL